jgi:hypothetical protein
MPAPTATDDALQGAKAALATAKAKFPTAPAAPAAPVKPKMAAPAAPKGDDTAGGLAWRAQQIKENPTVLGQFKDGGKVPKTGVYKLHKDETVLTADEGKAIAKKKDKDSGMGMATMALGMKKSPGGKTRMHIESSDNDGFITKSHSEDADGKGDGREQVHVHPSLDHLVDHVKKTYGAAPDNEPNEESEAAEAEKPTAAKPGELPGA